MIHTFEAEFPKPASSPLGIQLSLVNTPDREGLVVEKVAEGGAVDTYNKKSPEGYRIQEGDLVVKVNGVPADSLLAHHMPAIAGKVMEASTIRLEVRRYCAGPNMPAAGTTPPSKSPNLLPPPNFQDPPAPGGWAGTQVSAQQGADADAGQGAVRAPWKGMQGQTTPFLGMDPSNAPDSAACAQAPNQAEVDNLLMQGQLARAMGMPLPGGPGCQGCGGGCGGGCGSGCGCGCRSSGCGGCGGCGCSGCGGCGGCGCGGCGCCGGQCQNNPCGCGGCGGCGCGCGPGGHCGCGGCGQYSGCGGCGGCGLQDGSISGIQTGLAQLQQQLQLQQQQLQQQVMQSQANVLMSPPPPPPLPPNTPQMPRTPAQLPMNINALSKQAVQLQQKIAQLQQQLGLMGFADGNQAQAIMGEEEPAGAGAEGAAAFNQGRMPQQPDTNLASQQMMRMQQMSQPPQPPQHPPKLQGEKEAPQSASQDPNNFTFEVYLQRLEGMRLGLSVLPVTIHDVAALWVNDVSEGGAVDAWNKSVCAAFHVRSGDAITRVFDAAGDHAKMMEVLQSHRNIRLAVLRQGGSGAQQQPPPAQAAKAPAKPAQLQPALPPKTLPAQRQAEDMSQSSARPLTVPVPSLAPGLSLKGNDEVGDSQTHDSLEQMKSGPPGLPVPLNSQAAEGVDDPGDLIGSIDIQESGTNGPLRFKVVLARKGPGRLGIDVVLKREANFCGLLVYNVSEGGRVEAWNEQSQMPYRVLPGDNILEVNDISISGESNAQNDKFAVRMIQELSKDQKNVHFTVERSQGTLGLGEDLVLSQDDDEDLVLGGDGRPLHIPRPVGLDKMGQDDLPAGLAKSAQMKAMPATPNVPIPMQRWERKAGAPLPPGAGVQAGQRVDDSFPDGEADGFEGDGAEFLKEEETAAPPTEETKHAKEEKPKAKSEEDLKDAKEEKPKAKSDEEDLKETKDAKEEKPKAKSEEETKDAKEEKPKAMSEEDPKAKAEPKEAEAKLSLPAPPSGPAPPPPEAQAPKAKGQG
ncbi:Synaptic vesicle 2-related protein [Durusdinium trenchii]|uniref:Synaptic vesicle 2-related protein n=1 Tax=Durusdinium trenchii TaxID=1381693 RepID=A0ABP0HPJ7_9DINO